MHILILGGGVIGVVSAYYLAKQGHRVTVVERHSAVAEEASYANGGQLCYSCVNPLKYRAGKEMATNARRRFRNQLFLEVRAAFIALIEDMGVRFDYQLEGTLQLYFNQESLEEALDACIFKGSLGIPYQALSPAACIQREPALAGAEFTGGILFPEDGTGDVLVFTRVLAGLLVERGVQFQYQTTVTGWRTEGDRIAAIVTDQGELVADAYVLALGAHSAGLAKPLGIALPIVPKRGYSITIPLEADDIVPQLGIGDPENEMYYSRMGAYLRIAGVTERPSYALDIPPERIAWMMAQADRLFPRLHLKEREHRVRACLRPSSADSAPIIGKTAYTNLYMNTGHGGFGWTLAPISGKRLASVIQ